MKRISKDQILNLLETEKNQRALEFYLFDYFVGYYEALNKKEIDESDKDEVVQSIMDNFGNICAGIRLMASMYESHGRNVRTKYAELYKDSEVAYNTIIKRFNDLCYELKLSNSLEKSLLFTYLLYGGYFSITGRHEYKMEGRLTIPGFYSFDIFLGGGVCLSYSDMLTDILSSDGYHTSTIINDSLGVSNRLYTPNIERNIANPKFCSRMFQFLIKGISKKTGNHACTLIMEDDKPYIYDPTNLTMFECVNNKVADSSLLVGDIKLKPYFSLVLGDSDTNYETIKNLCLRSDYISPYDRKNFIFTAEECVETFNANKSIFCDYYDDIMPEITDIVEDVKVKNKKKFKI